MSLRTKLTLAILFTSFTAIAVVGATARSVTLSRFDDFVVDRAVEGFRREVAEYYRAYGSWDAAIASEPFFEFANRMRLDGRARRRPRRSVSDTERGEAGAGAGPRGTFALGGDPPPFVVTDREGTVLFPLAGMQAGERVSRHRLSLGRPIAVDREVIGLAVPLQRPALTELEERYLSTMEDSWLLALLVAFAMSIPLGLLLGSRLARPIREMTAAMGAMSLGDLRQEVGVHSEDEVGQLARSFNRMSSELADTYEALEASRARLAELSRHDGLTGLFNRRAFDETATALLAQARRYDHDMCVAMLDIDGFKRINDRFSHAVGDEVLVRTAKLLTEALRESDVVARYGGEEFVVAFPETSGEDAAVLAERIRDRFEHAAWNDLISDGPVTVSIGVAPVLETDGLTDALGRADERLYAAKHGGKNRVVV